MQLLPPSFFLRTDVTQIAKDLLGKVLLTRFGGRITSGIITETEAYRAPDDKACHAYNNRRTARTELMFQEGGRAYIYLCYGIHHLFNVVTAPEGMAHAVLIRAVEPLEGLNTMLERRNKIKCHPTLTTGPGALSQALGLHTAQNGQSLLDNKANILVLDPGDPLILPEIEQGTRIGVAFSEECATWPWRFWLKNSKYHK